MKTNHQGSCHCGNIKLEATGNPSSIVVCHCKDCRKYTGAPFAVFVDYPKNHVRFLGGVFIGVGLLLFSGAFALNRMRALLLAITGLVFVGGIARLSVLDLAFYKT